jgi:hypothetical protein
MFLKNYTSDVPVHQTIYRIEQVLIKCGVQGITKEYGGGMQVAEVTAVTFHIPMEGRELTVRLPADVDRALEALWLDYADGEKLTDDGARLQWSKKKKVRADFVEQAKRTAWKIIQDWVEVQMSMIQLKQAETLQVFLPYVYDRSLKSTVYDRVKAQGYRALIGNGTEQ